MFGVFVVTYAIGVAIFGILAALVDLFLYSVGWPNYYGNTAPSTQFYNLLAVVWVLVALLVPLVPSYFMLYGAERRMSQLNRPRRAKPRKKR